MTSKGMKSEVKNTSQSEGGVKEEGEEKEEKEKKEEGGHSLKRRPRTRWWGKKWE